MFFCACVPGSDERDLSVIVDLGFIIPGTNRAEADMRFAYDGRFGEDNIEVHSGSARFILNY